jgi:hypothetical protein
VFVQSKKHDTGSVRYKRRTNSDQCMVGEFVLNTHSTEGASGKELWQAFLLYIPFGQDRNGVYFSAFALL